MKIKIVVAGEPQGKGRPRFIRTATGGRAITPPKTRAYEDFIKWEYTRQCNYFFKDKTMLKMEINAFFKVPSSKSKKQKEKMLNNEIRPTKKPDMDNIVKAVADALNKVAYIDDSQIVECIVKKYYSKEPRIEIFIEEIKKEME